MNQSFSQLHKSEELKNEYRIAVKGKTKSLLVSSMSFIDAQKWLIKNPNPYRQ